MMNNLFYKTVLLLLLGGSATAQNVGIGTAVPAAKLDIAATDEGLLIPRVTLSATNVAAPLTAPTTSEIVYNTATAGTSPTNVIPGYYYWNGTEWLRLISSADMDEDWMRAVDDQLAYSVNDNIYTMGQVGIGTNTMGNGRLTIMGNGTDLVQFQDNGGENEWHLRTQGTGNANLGFTETGVADHRLVLKAGGNIGIGVDDPDESLHIVGNQQANSQAGGLALNDEVSGLILEQRHSTNKTLEGVANAGFTGPLIDLRTTNGTNRWSVGQIMGLIDAGGTNHAGGLAFTTSIGGNTNPADSRTIGGRLPIRMLIQSDGDVGIGTVTPQNKLDVNGYIKVGDQAVGGANIEGSMRYNSTKKCLEIYDGTTWKCAGEPDIQTFNLRDGVNETLDGSGGNINNWNTGGYGFVYNFTVNNCRAGRKILFLVELVLGTGDRRANNGFNSRQKLYGHGIFTEKDIPLVGNDESQTTFFWGTPNASGNLNFSFENNSHETNVRITTIQW